ncbi:substrate-binding domain-containing protein [Streptomyces sp. MnatMP-M17]|uniref:sugar ABC transporter substrate-binding protein n=1 Tax=unclassified Streptomyces TaxID=2593676 RepID=UPI00210CBC04|nr:substrate-binding domain-containing protein [Streptomyces sp. MnatMP-M17]
MDEAKKAGVIVAVSSVPDQAQSMPGFAVVTNGRRTNEQVGEIEANMLARESKCAANVAVVSLPFPILKADTDKFKSTLASLCPQCKVSEVLLQPQDIGTPNATNTIVSKLQASPSTKYVYALAGNLTDGLSPALRQAGLNDVKIFGTTPDEAAIAALRDGSHAWWINVSSVMQGWTAFDGILRAIDTGKVVNDNGYPISILTPKNVPSGTGMPVEPATYREDFTALWKVK